MKVRWISLKTHTLLRYKTKKTLQDKGLNTSLLNSTVPTSSVTFAPGRRIPVQMLVRDGKPCPQDFAGAYQTPTGLSGSFPPPGGYLPQAATGLPQNSQYYMPNGWAWWMILWTKFEPWNLFLSTKKRESNKIFSSSKYWLSVRKN